MKPDRIAQLGCVAALITTACEKEQPALDTREKVVATVQPSAFATSIPSAPSVSAKPEPVGKCPPDMVKVADRFCIDRYEATMYDTKLGRRASRHYHPSQYSVEKRYQFFKEADEAWSAYQEAVKAADGDIVNAGIDASYDLEAGPPTLFKMPIPKPEPWQFEEYFKVKAVSEAGQMPNAFLSGIIAKSACKNAGKRLCTEAEWVTACRGENNTKFPYGDTYEEGACNIYRQGHVAQKLHGHYNWLSDPRLNLVPIQGQILLEKTGNRPRCKSKWGDDGIYDMVGNLDEWIDDPRGTFLGGFYSHQTDKGCEKKEEGHVFKYYDYSLGVRCCLDLILNQD